MSLLVLMYHRAQAGRYGNSPEMLDAHFAHLARYSNVMPGEPLLSGKLNVCLSFDDGYFDFYATVFPLLRKHNLRALLAVSPSTLCERSDMSQEERLRITSEDAYAGSDGGGFCTWTELKLMVVSGYVTIAAHGFSHTRLDLPDADLVTEIGMPQYVLEAQLKQRVESFVFPFGRFSRLSLQTVHESYQYVFRIGGALNYSWKSPVIYRVDADAMETPSSLFSPARMRTYRMRYFWNRLRGR